MIITASLLNYLYISQFDDTLLLCDAIVASVEARHV